MRKYLLAADGSDNSRRAAYFLLDLVREHKQAEVTVVHVINVRKEIFNYSVFADIDAIEKIVREQGKQVVDDMVAIFENEGIKVNKVVLEGDPGQEIAWFAEEGGFNQIVMGSRGLSNIKGLVMGSVSHQVLHYAKNPVTLVK